MTDDLDTDAAIVAGSGSIAPGRPVFRLRTDEVVGHVVGGAQQLYGKARVQFRDIAEDAPYYARQTGDRLRVAARKSARAADDGVRDHPFLIAAVAGASAYLLSWLIHGRRD